MGLNKTSGNMYSFIDYTWNPVKGKCSHDCDYCYMKRWGELPPIRLAGEEFTTNLGSNNTIFVGSSNDLFQDCLPYRWINKIMEHCKNFPDNRYIFQSKNTKRMVELQKLHNQLPQNVTFATTVESNRDYKLSYNTPHTWDRLKMIGHIGGLQSAYYHNVSTMITIEPIVKFDLKQFVRGIRWIADNIDLVTIGADSGNNFLPQPDYGKVMKFKKEIEKYVDVHLKDNLKNLEG